LRISSWATTKADVGFAPPKDGVIGRPSIFLEAAERGIDST
jgi:hypothetical protein